jgi:hypothetical protein
VQENSQIWQIWADVLNRWGVKDLTAAFLEALGPINMLGAQLVYMGQPFLTPYFSEGYLDVLAELLEDPQETQAFIAVLRQSDQPTRA